ncbi:MAG: phosphatase PAP2 family protein [Bacteroidales bacterium]|nr:phosphatase PAP2 family protein [Bacteroidales bacterium]
MILKEGKYFLSFTTIYIIVSGLLLVFFSKPEIAIAINKFNSPFCDVFFKNITHLGTGYLLIPILIILLITNQKRAVIISILSSILTLFIAGGLKRITYSERPARFFENSNITDYNFHVVNGVDLHFLHSFPSGHTATAFLTFFLAAIFLSPKKAYGQVIFFILAFLVAYSRMYLHQHFLIDNLAGAIIGVLTVFIADFIVSKKFKTLI